MTKKCYVLREVLVGLDQLKPGDIFRMEDDPLRLYSITSSGAEVSASGDYIKVETQSQTLSLPNNIRRIC